MRFPSDPALSGETSPTSATTSPGDAAPAVASPDARYERRGVLGEGGMGRVVLARDRLLDRDVALKEVIARGAGDPDRRLEARLEREARVTARLEHPGIVPLYDAGRRTDGSLYYTMRVVRGRSLEDIVKDAPDEGARLGLVKHVHGAAQAVAWAHAHGVVHRDLKPANIMIGELGETQVVDWGLAREIEGRDVDADPAAGADDPALTQLGAIVGTPQYLSPEQAHGGPASPRSDVFALGITLYEVTSGRIARPVESTEQALVHARAGFVPDPSGLPPDLLAIVRRATAHRPDHRYADARALAEDLSAWLDGRRVSAHGYTATELLVRLVRAWRVPILVGAGALLAGAIALVLAFAEIRGERDRAELEERRASAAEQRERAARRQAEEDLGRSLATAARARAAQGARPEAEILAARALTHLETPDARGVLLSTSGVIAPRRIATVRLDDPGGIRLGPGETWLPSPDGRRALSFSAKALTMWDLDARRPLWTKPGGALAAVHLPADQRVVMTNAAGGIELLDQADGRSLKALSGCCVIPLAAPGGRGWYASAARDGANSIVIGADVGAPEEVLLRRCGESVRAFDGARAFLACVDGGFSVREADGAIHEGRIADLGGARLAGDALLIPGGDALVGGTKGELLRVRLPDGEVVGSARLGHGVVFRLAIDQGGALAALVDEQAGVLLFDARTLAPFGRLPANEGLGVRFIASNNDDHDHGARRLVTWSAARMSTWEIAPSWPDALPVAQGVAGFAVGRGHMSVAGNLGASTWDLAAGAMLEHRPQTGVVKGVTLPDDFGVFFAGRIVGAALLRFAPGERDLELPVQASLGGLRRLLQLRDGRMLIGPDFGPLAILDGALDAVWRDELPCRTIDAAVSAGARTAAALCGVERTVRRVEIGDGVSVGTDVAADAAWRALAIAPDGMRFALSRGDSIDLVDEAGRTIDTLMARSAADVLELAWSADGRWIAGGGRDGHTWIWSVPDGRLAAVIADHDERVAALAFDGAWLYSGSWDRTVRRRDLGLLAAPAGALLETLERGWNRGFADIVSEGL